MKPENADAFTKVMRLCKSNPNKYASKPNCINSKEAFQTIKLLNEAHTVEWFMEPGNTKICTRVMQLCESNPDKYANEPNCINSKEAFQTINRQVVRVYSDMNSLRTVFELCFNEGRFTLVQRSNQCQIEYHCSERIEEKQDSATLCVAKTDALQISTFTLAQPTTTTTTWTGSEQFPVSEPTLTPAIPAIPAPTATITATFNHQAAAVLQGKTLTFTRKEDGSWACSSTFPAEYAPRGCEK